MRPHNLPFVLLGVGLLWFGWFGFNAGSALAANGTAAAIFLNTLVAGCLGHAGLAFGGSSPRWQADHIRCGLGCGRRPGRDHPVLRNGEHTRRRSRRVWRRGSSARLRSGSKFRFGYDDSLDVVGVHFVGGVVGVLLIGLLATQVMTGGPQGLFYAGGFAQLGKQALAAIVVGLYAFVGVIRVGEVDRPR